MRADNASNWRLYTAGQALDLVVLSQLTYASKYFCTGRTYVVVVYERFGLRFQGLHKWQDGLLWMERNNEQLGITKRQQCTRNEPVPPDGQIGNLRMGVGAYGQLCFKVTPIHIDWVVPALTRCDSHGKPLSR